MKKPTEWTPQEWWAEWRLNKDNPLWRDWNSLVSFTKFYCAKLGLYCDL